VAVSQHRLDLLTIRWLFIIEGAITIAAALFSLFILPDYPAT
jgi:hypothetical protein